MADDKKPAQDTPKPGDDTKTEDALYGKDGKKPEGEKQLDGEKKPDSKDEKKPDDKAGDDKEKPKPGSDDKGSKDEKDDADSKVPEKYELQRPEDEAITDGDMAEYIDAAKAIGATLGQAKKFVQFQAERRVKVRDGFLADLKADTDLGGDRLKTSVDVANKGLKAFMKESPQDEQDIVLGLLLRSGFANHKALVRAFARLGKSVAEDKPDHSGKGGAGDRKSDAEMFYGRKD